MAVKNWSLVGVAAVAVAGLMGVASQPENKPGELPSWLTPELMQEMEVCMKAAQPGPEHEWLGKMVGTWEGKNKMWMTPDAPAMETTSTARFVSTLGGRFIHGEFKGPIPGNDEMFEGATLYGYDNAAKEFQVVWVDNMGTGMMFGTGKLSDDRKVMTWTMHWNHPTRGKITFREVDTVISDDEYRMEMYGPDLKGNEYRMMEIISRRVKKD